MISKVILNSLLAQAKSANTAIDKWYKDNNLYEPITPSGCTCKDNGDYTRFDGYDLKIDDPNLLILNHHEIDPKAIELKKNVYIHVEGDVEDLYTNFDPTDDKLGALGGPPYSPMSFYDEFAVQGQDYVDDKGNVTLSPPDPKKHTSLFFELNTPWDKNKLKDRAESWAWFWTDSGRIGVWSSNQKFVDDLLYHYERKAPNHFFCRKLCDTIAPRKIREDAFGTYATAPCIGYEWNNDMLEAPATSSAISNSPHNFYRYDWKTNGYPDTDGYHPDDYAEAFGSIRVSNKMNGFSSKCRLFFYNDANGTNRPMEENKAMRTIDLPKSAIHEWDDHTIFAKQCTCGDYDPATQRIKLPPGVKLPAAVERLPNRDDIEQKDDISVLLLTIVGIITGAIILVGAAYYWFSARRQRAQGFSQIEQTNDADWTCI